MFFLGIIIVLSLPWSLKLISSHYFKGLYVSIYHELVVIIAAPVILAHFKETSKNNPDAVDPAKVEYQKWVVEESDNTSLRILNLSKIYANKCLYNK